MEEVKYLWMNNSDQNKQRIYMYLNEKNEIIMGNIIGKSPTISPYNENSIYYNNSQCVGVAKKFVKSINNILFK